MKRDSQDISKQAQVEYRRLRHRERKLYERDVAHKLLYYDDERFKIQLVDDMTTFQFLEESQHQELIKGWLTCLPYALEWLKTESPDHYILVLEYYFSEEKPNMRSLGQKYGISHQAISKKLKRARTKIQQFIVEHKYLCCSLQQL